MFNNISKPILCLLIIAISSTKLHAQVTDNYEEFVYNNPNDQLPMRDTHIIANPDDGKFYAIGTLNWGGSNTEGDAGFRLYISEDLKDWEPGPWIMKQKNIPEEAWYKSVFWAPEIHKFNDKWYFTYNCDGVQQIDKERYGSPHGAGVAVSDKITGPYRDLSNKPLVQWPHNDLTLFQDDNNKVYALFNNGHFNLKNYPDSKHSIFVAEINLDSGELVETPHKLLTQQGEFESFLIEGAHMIKVDSIYYLFYSCYDQKGYAVADNIYGPYIRATNSPLLGARYDGGLIKDGTIIYNTESRYCEAGHNQIFKGPDNQYWTSYHAYIRSGDDKIGPLLVIDPLYFNDGLVSTPAPSWGEQRSLLDPKMAKMFPGLVRVN
ncbi:MAG: family 43 glycosylhydrolase [Rikenellaceae bacterium]